MDFFDDSINMDTQAGEFIYVDTEIYPDKLKAGLIIYLFTYLKSFSSHEKVMVIDEAWDIIKDCSEYVGKCFRTFRKHNTSAIAISQSIDDFCDDDLGKVIFNNSHFKFVFRQSIARNPFISESDKEIIKSLKSIKGEYSQFYLTSLDGGKVLNYFASPSEYELFTSNKTDNKKINKFIELNAPYYNFKESFDRWVDFKYMYGGDIL